MPRIDQALKASPYVTSVAAQVGGDLTPCRAKWNERIASQAY